MLVFFYEIYEQKIVLVPILTLSVISPLILNNNKKRDNLYESQTNSLKPILVLMVMPEQICIIFKW